MNYNACDLCPRMCGINRYQSTGYCGCKTAPKAAKAALHHWEEPCISGTRGSGAVFFSGCVLRCCFCQNHKISSGRFGKELTPEQLGAIFLKLQGLGAHNINLVTATQYLPSVIQALDLVKSRLHIPIVYNCGGYERLDTIRKLQGYVDVWLPDLKYYDSSLSARYSQAPDYFEVASLAILEMIRQAGPPEFISLPDSSYKIMTKGTLIRHLILPGQKEDSIRLLGWIKETLPKESCLISLMSQYTPLIKSTEYPELNRRITSYEYNKVIDKAIELGLTNGYMQKKSSAKEEYTPPFDLEGID